jgi:hypothetical protein
MEVSDQMTDTLYHLFNRRWDSCRVSGVVAGPGEGARIRWNFLLDQLGVKGIITAGTDRERVQAVLRKARLEQKIVIPDPSCLGPYGHLIIPREIAEKILVLGHIP